MVIPIIGYKSEVNENLKEHLNLIMVELGIDIKHFKDAKLKGD